MMIYYQRKFIKFSEKQLPVYKLANTGFPFQDHQVHKENLVQEDREDARVKLDAEENEDHVVFLERLVFLVQEGC